MTNVLINPEAFPMVFKDIDFGAYYIECKSPDQTTDLRKTQIMLDTHMLSVVAQHPDIFLQKAGWYFKDTEISLNPSIAIVEQILSTSRDHARRNLEEFVEALQDYGMFGPDYSNMMLDLVVKNEGGARQQVGVFFCYLTMLRYLYFSKIPPSELLPRWAGFFAEDIPRLSTVYILGAVLLLSKLHKDLRFARHDGKISDFASKFFDGKKEEKKDVSRWLRNRTFDITSFMMAPVLNFEASGGINSRVVIVSRDTFIGEFVGRLVMWGGEQSSNNHWLLAVAIHMLDQQSDSIKRSIQMIYDLVSPARPPSASQNKDRLWNLVDITMKSVGPAQWEPLNKALTEYRYYEMLT